MNFIRKLFSSKTRTPEKSNKPKYDEELLQSNIAKWKAGRKEYGENPDVIDSVFQFLIDNSLFTQELNEKLDELYDYGEYNGKESLVLNRLLASSSSAFNFIFEIDENDFHPYDFNKTYLKGVKPILDLNNINNITFSFEQNILGDPIREDYEYIYKFESGSNKITKTTNSGDDYLNDFFIALNTILEKSGHDKKFYDSEMDNMILLDYLVAEKIKTFKKIPLK